MDANAPNEDTLKQRFIAGLRDLSAQQHISLSRPATLVAAKDVARMWEEVQLGQQQRRELLFEPMQGTDSVPTSGATQANPTTTPSAFMAAMNMPQEFVPRAPPFQERLKVEEKFPKKKQVEEGMDIVQRLAETKVTLDLATLLRCSPTYKKQFYNEFIKKPRKAKRKEKVDDVVLGTIQSIKNQVDSNAPTITVEINGYAVPDAQLDSGAVVNLMTEYMMKALGLTQLEDTPMSLQMADQTEVKPAGLIRRCKLLLVGSNSPLTTWL
ncbi:hypothetical protein KP509_07G073900 [Ceratopteris richardii]|uniref:Uncharacterized protein n=1 Tax=Ceratopteris richardii TaxID=49495 RepID=A0A8T2UI44_CERRI|nr:hypothetical protein KP509_07G073900 [Ceratopteris richardii]